MCHHHRAAAWIHFRSFLAVFREFMDQEQWPVFFNKIFYIFFISFSHISRESATSIIKKKAVEKSQKILHTEIAQRIRMNTKKNWETRSLRPTNRKEDLSHQPTEIQKFLLCSADLIAAAASSPRMASVDLIKTVFFSSLCTFRTQAGKGSHTPGVAHIITSKWDSNKQQQQVESEIFPSTTL